MGFMPHASDVFSQHNTESHFGSGQFSHLYGKTRCVSTRRMAFANTELWASFLMDPKPITSQAQRR